jgi:hypothetical protein
MLSGFDCSAPPGLAAPRSGKARLTEPRRFARTTINTALPSSALLPHPASLSNTFLARPPPLASSLGLIHAPLDPFYYAIPSLRAEPFGVAVAELCFSEH